MGADGCQRNRCGGLWSSEVTVKLVTSYCNMPFRSSIELHLGQRQQDCVLQ